jgi:hypothetical protein
MTQNNGNPPDRIDRIDRIEATLDRLAAQSEVTRVQLETGINDVVGMIGILANMQEEQGQRIDALATLVGTVTRGQEEQGRRIEQLVSEVAQFVVRRLKTVKKCVLLSFKSMRRFKRYWQQTNVKSGLMTFYSGTGD